MDFRSIVHLIIGVAVIMGIAGMILQYFMYGTVTSPCCLAP